MAEANDAQSRVRLKAAILTEEQCDAPLQVAHVERDLLPVKFRLINDSRMALSVRQDDFRLLLDHVRRIAPALPGRAASLLRDESASTGAMWAGYLALGILAAPALHAAENSEEAAMRSARELFFDAAEIAPGASLDGYLVFESPLPIVELDTTVLQMRQASGPLIELRLSNPYSSDH